MPHDTCHATRSMPGVHRMLGVMLHVECQVCLCAREEERRLQHYALVVEHVWTLLHIVAFARHCRLVHLPTDSIPTRALYAVQRVRCMLCNVFLALARRSPPTCWCVICCRPRAVVSVAWCVIHVAWFPTHCGCSFRSVQSVASCAVARLCAYHQRRPDRSMDRFSPSSKSLGRISRLRR